MNLGDYGQLCAVVTYSLYNTKRASFIYAYLEYIQNIFVRGGGKLVLVCIRSKIVGKTGKVVNE